MAYITYETIDKKLSFCLDAEDDLFWINDNGDESQITGSELYQKIADIDDSLIPIFLLKYANDDSDNSEESDIESNSYYDLHGCPFVISDECFETDPCQHYSMLGKEKMCMRDGNEISKIFKDNGCKVPAHFKNY